MATASGTFRSGLAILHHCGHCRLLTIIQVSLPAELANLKDCLTVLNISRNDLKMVPSCISELTSLRTLLLDCNPLDELPDWLCGLKQLTALGASHTLLDHIPNWIEQELEAAAAEWQAEHARRIAAETAAAEALAASVASAASVGSAGSPGGSEAPAAAAAFDQTATQAAAEGIEQAALSVPKEDDGAGALPPPPSPPPSPKTAEPPPTQSAGTILASLGIRTRGAAAEQATGESAEATAWTTRPRLMTITTHGTVG